MKKYDLISLQSNDIPRVKNLTAPDSETNEEIVMDRSPDLGFTFRFQTFEEFCSRMKENRDDKDDDFQNHALEEIGTVEEKLSYDGDFDLSDSEIIIPNPTEDANLSDGYFCSDTDSESLYSSDEFSVKSHSIDSNSNHDVFSEEETWSNGSDDCRNPNLQLSSTCFEETTGLEKLWEHQEFLEQLKAELKKVRATGLPTILEDSEECPNMADLKPWKIDDAFRHGNPMNELFKFYKSYREKMRKFDIIIYQKMYATGFLKLKDPFESIPNRKSPKTTILRILSNNLNFRRRGMEHDPTKKFLEDLYDDLETTYVGQMCLSWEFLHWQYQKALKMWESDPRGTHSYNIVAGEFQQFQVLTERFIENEAFQGPRVQNYVKTRCAHRNLLQVPVIRDDGYKKAKKQRGDNEITCDILIEMLEESIRIFWRFVLKDKDASTLTLMNIKPHESYDPNLLIDIRKDLQKKERKLKATLRRGSCLLRRVKRHYEDDNSDQALFFFSQVDLKLVTRVMNMSKMSKDQLSWCCSKLNNINFVNRKICIDSSFLLFPCS